MPRAADRSRGTARVGRLMAFRGVEYARGDRPRRVLDASERHAMRAWMKSRHAVRFRARRRGRRARGSARGSARGARTRAGWRTWMRTRSRAGEARTRGRCRRVSINHPRGRADWRKFRVGTREGISRAEARRCARDSRARCGRGSGRSRVGTRRRSGWSASRRRGARREGRRRTRRSLSRRRRRGSGGCRRIGCRRRNRG